MKYIWETDDIQAGRRITSHNKSEDSIIGYDPAGSKTEGFWILISLTDGMLVTKPWNSEQLAKWLTVNNYSPCNII